MKPCLILAILFSAHVVRAEETSTFVNSIQGKFTAWDADKDQTLTLGEVDRAIADAQVKGSAAAAVVALRRGMRTAKEDGISQSDLERKPGPEFKTDYQSLFNWSVKRLAESNRTLFLSSPPKIDALKQGKLGDCFCLAALRSMLSRDPMEIIRMIQPKPEGGYQVRIGAEMVETPALTDGEIILGASTTDGLWPLVYEKAVGISLSKKAGKDATPFNVVTKGGSAGTMMSVLTTHPIKRWSCKIWRDAAPDTAKQAELLDALRAQLKSAIAEKRLVTGGTAALSPKQTKVPGMVYNHGYAVLGYDAATDKIRLWNPQAGSFTPKGLAGIQHGYAMDQGRQSMPLTELVTFYGGFAFEQAPGH